jgi:anthranilate phosphoribosyltransferase
MGRDLLIKDAIARLIDRQSLTEHEAEAVMAEIMDGQATPAQIASYLTALRMKGETVEEITGSARAMRGKAIRIHPNDPIVVDTCGTGGDGAGTFNVSTTVALVLAGAGITVAKHGNRAVSSRAGSADILQGLGVRIDLAPEQVEECINEIGIGFLFAPLFHTAMKYAASSRQEIGVRTIFNILGPLTNPAGASVQILGVYEQMLTETLAKVLMNLGARHCYVVHGLDGLDEITLTTRTRVTEGKGSRITSYFIEPRDFGFERARLKDLSGGDMEENARITRDILEGREGPRQQLVLLNAAPALVACGKAETLQEGVERARLAIRSGAAMDKLENLIKWTNGRR